MGSRRSLERRIDEDILGACAFFRQIEHDESMVVDVREFQMRNSIHDSLESLSRTRRAPGSTGADGGRDELDGR